MTCDHPINRRTFLGRSVGVVLVATVGVLKNSLAWATAGTRDQFIRLVGKTFGGSRPSFEVLGRIYIRSLPGKPDPRSIADTMLANTPSLSNAVLNEDREELRRIIVNAVKKDFTDGKIVAVEGYMLSQTEVALCQLFVLSN